MVPSAVNDEVLSWMVPSAVNDEVLSRTVHSDANDEVLSWMVHSAEVSSTVEQGSEAERNEWNSLSLVELALELNPGTGDRHDK